jgi:hypothetical protein
MLTLCDRKVKFVDLSNSGVDGHHNTVSTSAGDDEGVLSQLTPPTTGRTEVKDVVSSNTSNNNSVVLLLMSVIRRSSISLTASNKFGCLLFTLVKTYPDMARDHRTLLIQCVNSIEAKIFKQKTLIQLNKL